jgi:hypothetical protein
VEESDLGAALGLAERSAQLPNKKQVEQLKVQASATAADEGRRNASAFSTVKSIEKAGEKQPSPFRPFAAIAHEVSSLLSSYEDRHSLDQDDPGASGSKSSIFGDYFTRGRFVGGCIAGTIVLGILVWQLAYGGKPFKMTPWLPACVIAFVPAGFVDVQDLDHLVMLICFLTSIAMLIRNIIIIKQEGCGEGIDETCMLEFVSCAYLVPCIWYVYCCIGSYDSRLCARQQEAAEKRRENIELQKKTLEETEGYLEKAADSSAGLAEKNFEEKKRDFGRFLAWVSTLSQDQATSVDVPLRRNLLQWLRVFQETSFDPLNQPRDGGLDVPFDEVVRTTSDIRDAAKNLKDRLKAENVHFIAMERENVKERRKTVNAMSANNAAVATIQKIKSRMDHPSWLSSGSGRCGCEVMQIEESGGQEGFPLICMCCCFNMTVLSRTHLLLICWMCFGVALVSKYLYDGFANVKGDDDGHIAMEVGLVMIAVCLAIIIWNFERIDNMMRLETEIQELQQEIEAAEVQRKRVGEMFGRHQIIVSMWLFRTVPVLELQHEIQERLRDYADTSFGLVAKQMERGCALVDVVFQRLGSVKEWIDQLTQLQVNERKEHDGPGMGGEDNTPTRQESNDGLVTTKGGSHTVLGDWVKKQTIEQGDIVKLLATCEKQLPQLQVTFD